MSFRREKYAPKGGPDGGDGGRGGDVIFRVNPHLSSLAEFQYNQRFIARDGNNGLARKKHGKSASPLFIRVPAGTVITNADTGETLADLTESGEEFVVAKGGRGGLGNVHFKTSTRQAPRIAELGEPGEELNLQLELRIIADVGLVGLPNAGKSTLLAASTRAQPKIADYPFTTLAPNLGVVQVGGRAGSTLVMADVPGLIEGAAAGAGLGHEFLRHVSRTKLLVHVLDASGGLEGRDPLVDFDLINAEIEAYDSGLADRTMIVALNKIDLVEARENVDELRKAIEARGFPVYEISAATGEGVQPLLNELMKQIEQIRSDFIQAEKPQEVRRYTLKGADERAWTVTENEDGFFVIRGISIERLAKMTNFDQPDAVDRFQRVLEVSGISEELTRQGVEPGDTVIVAGLELTWGEEFEIDDSDAPRRTARQRRFDAEYHGDEVEDIELEDGGDE